MAATAPAAPRQASAPSSCHCPYVFGGGCGKIDDLGYETLNFYRANENGTPNPKQYQYQHETSTGKLFGGPLGVDSRDTVACKCVMISLGIFPYAGALIVYNVFATLGKVIYATYRAFTNLAKDLEEKHVIKALEDFALACVEIGKKMGIGIWRIVRAPFFALAILFSTLLAFYDPYVARTVIGDIEYTWHDYTSIKLDPRLNKTWRESPPPKTLDEFVKSCNHMPEVLYLAFCFQSVGKFAEATPHPTEKTFLVLPHKHVQPDYCG